MFQATFSAASFEYIRATAFGGRMTQKQVDGINIICEAWCDIASKYGEKAGLDELAHILGTVHHETARTMQPIDEYGKGRGKRYRSQKMNGQPHRVKGRHYFGRGYVQLTWWDNYRKFSDILGVDLVSNPDLAKEPLRAAEILITGMMEGLFTGYSIADTDDYIEVSDRKAVNGMDRANLITQYSDQYKIALEQPAHLSDVATVVTSKPMIKSKTVGSAAAIGVGGLVAGADGLLSKVEHVKDLSARVESLGVVEYTVGLVSINTLGWAAALGLLGFIIYERYTKSRDYGI